MIDNWTKVTVGKYQEIKLIVDSGAEPEVVNTELISCLTDLDVEEILDMPLTRYNNFLQCTGFLYEDMPKRQVATKYVLGGTQFNVMLNIEEMTAAQFIDYQNYIKDIDKNIVQLLSIFLIPKGHKYNDGYDMLETQKIIRDNLCVCDAGAMSAFFLEWYNSLLTATVRCLTKRMKKMMKKETNQETIEKMKETIAFLEKSGNGLQLLTEYQKQ